MSTKQTIWTTVAVIGAVVVGSIAGQGAVERQAVIDKYKDAPLHQLTKIAFDCQTGKIKHADCGVIITLQTEQYKAQQRVARAARELKARSYDMARKIVGR